MLAALLERPRELVTREELRSKLWPADTFVDFDHSLNAAIKRLRDAFGESAETPIFVETVPRRGYRFIAPVNGAASEVGVAVAPELSKPSLLRPWMTIAFLSMAAIAILVWALWRHLSRTSEVVEHKLTANSSENGVKSAAVSPDGKFLAYSDNTGLYVKEIRTGETHRVTLPQNFSADVNDWFPDGAHLLVSQQEQPGKLSLWSVSVFGGTPRQLTNNGAGGSVSPDGAHIGFQSHGYGQEEWVMRSEGTDPVKVASDKSSWVGQPRWQSYRLHQSH